MQAAADVANMFLDIPDGFTAPATAAKQRQIVAVPLGMIARDQAQERRLSCAVGAGDLPVFVRIHGPGELIKNRAIVIRHDAIAQLNTRLVAV
ncbi:hypothetical protein D3C78_1102150 [compost metagenome]